MRKIINFIFVFLEDCFTISLEIGSNLDKILIFSVESHAIPYDLVDVLFEVLKTFVSPFVDFDSHGSEIHGFFDDDKVLRNAKFNGINWFKENWCWLFDFNGIEKHGKQFFWALLYLLFWYELWLAKIRVCIRLGSLFGWRVGRNRLIGSLFIEVMVGFWCWILANAGFESRGEWIRWSVDVSGVGECFR